MQPNGIGNGGGHGGDAEASGYTDEDIEYLRKHQVGQLMDSMIRDLLMSVPPLNPGKWVLRYLKTKMTNERYVPPKLWVSVDMAPELDGLYRYKGLFNDMPYWTSKGRAVYSTKSGWWMIADTEEKMHRNAGLVSGSSPHTGCFFPHQMDSWEAVKAGRWVETHAAVTDSLMVDNPASPRRPSPSPQPTSPHFSPGRWDSPRGIRPAGAGLGGDIFLPRAITTKVVSRVASERFAAGHAEMQGWRTDMEDSHSIGTDGTFVVCDGHGGAEVARVVARRLPDIIKAHPMAEACRLLDEQLPSTLSGGTTAVLCRLLPQRTDGIVPVECMHVGDSRIVVWSRRQQKVLLETEDHKPTAPKERARLEENGFEIIGGRIDSLAVSRSFGDVEEKTKGVIVDPDVVVVECQPGDVLLLGCDGVFDLASAEEVMRQTLETLEETGGDAAAAAAAVCDLALRKGSTDNISCLIVELTPGAHAAMEALPALECVPGPYSAPWSDCFRIGYLKATVEGGLTLPEALEKRYDDVCAKLSLMSPREESVDAIALRDEFALYHKDQDAIEVLRSLDGKRRTSWFGDWAVNCETMRSASGSG